uniref:Uncharacterized protein n=1 Tax=Plectus sambesii TaxID=2011161 RepID=A0A914X2Q5_9BILA
MVGRPSSARVQSGDGPLRRQTIAPPVGRSVSLAAMAVVHRVPKNGLPSALHDSTSRLRVIGVSKTDGTAFFYELNPNRSQTIPRGLLTLVIYSYHPSHPQSFRSIKEMLFAVPSGEVHSLCCRLDENSPVHTVEVQRVINSRFSSMTSSVVKLNRVSFDGHVLGPTCRGSLPFRIDKKLNGLFLASTCQGLVYVDGHFQRLRKVSVNYDAADVDDNGLLVDLVRVVRETSGNWDHYGFSYQLTEAHVLINVHEKKTLILYDLSRKRVDQIINARLCAYRWTISAGDRNFWATRANDNAIYRVNFDKGEVHMSARMRRPAGMSWRTDGHQSLIISNGVWFEVCSAQSSKELSIGCFRTKWRKDKRPILTTVPTEPLSLKELSVRVVHQVFGARQRIAGDWKGGISQRNLVILTGFNYSGRRS